MGMDFKYKIGDRFKFGIMDDIIVAGYTTAQGRIYTLQTVTGMHYDESETDLTNQVSRGRYAYIPRDPSEYIGDFDWFDNRNPNTEVDSKKSCTCESKDLFNYGCKCGYMEREKEKQE